MVRRLDRREESASSASKHVRERRARTREARPAGRAALRYFEAKANKIPSIDAERRRMRHGKTNAKAPLIMAAKIGLALGRYFTTT
jgi:hypothetical protein